MDLKSATQSDKRKLFIETYGCQTKRAKDSQVPERDRRRELNR
nr:MAG TPA: (dimethylallyl)adenosine tRNA methylthiotransferase [Caudoviricetes sp.]